MKVYFRGEPLLKPKSNGHKFEVMEFWIIIVNAITVMIPQGFWTDLASTGIFSPLNETMLPAILHDWLYYQQTMVGQPIKRKVADKIFLAGMKTTKVNVFKRNMYYYGVRLGGWKTWNRYKKIKLKKLNENIKIHKELLNKMDIKIKG